MTAAFSSLPSSVETHTFDGQFSDIIPFTHNVTVSLDFPTIISSLVRNASKIIAWFHGYFATAGKAIFF